MRKLRFTQNHLTKGNSQFCQVLSLLFAFFLTATVNTTANAQCAMTCNDDVNVSLPGPAAGCEITVTPDMVMEDPDACVGPYNVVIMTMQGVAIPNSPTIDDSYIGQTLMYQVTDAASNNSCWGQMDIEDKLGPSIDCAPVTVFCVEETTPESGMMPTIEDCSGDMTTMNIDFVDNIVDGDCSDTYSALINRTWVATDSNGNVSSCMQTVTVNRVSLSNFTPECPANVTLQCSADNPPNTDPENTGYPHFIIGSVSYDIIPGMDNFCELASSYSDEEFNLCGGGRKILRTWTVYDWCISTDTNENPYTCIQVIQVEDNEAPVIECPADFNIGSVTSACLATVIIPQPTSVTDGCSDVSVFVITPSGIKAIGDPVNLPVGTHPFTYVATDNCGNSSSCVVNVNVVDDTAPVAVCDEFTIVSLTGDGFALIAAQVFDDGSEDNCQIDRFEARRMNGDCAGDEDEFDEFVEFCCSDINDNVMVTFRVFDTYGNYNECMVEVDVQDKLDPTIVCPPNKTLECEGLALDLSNLNEHGEAVGSDNCGETTITEVVDDQRGTCGTGTLIRVFTATDESGRSATCSQTLTIVNSNPFSIDSVSWPSDYEVFECGANVDVDNLPIEPDNYREPLYSSNSCDLIAVTHEDTYLPINPPACYKILRKWIVIDWCQYDPNDTTPAGYGEWTQVIKVTDNDAPVLSCPDSLVVINQEQDCGNAPVTYEPFTATDCSSDLDYSYEIDVDSDGSTDIFANGNDISGNYPSGNHTVKVIASDGCGNVGVCSFPLIIRDGKKPTPICVNGVAIELMPMGDGGMIEVAADIIDYGSYDNCTAQADLTLELTPNMFNCNNVGTNVVTLTVTDEAGNADFCETYIIVQDNMNLCTPGAGGDQVIAGAISSEDGYAMAGVDINISGNGPTAVPTQTDENGEFEFIDLQEGYDYTVQPTMSEDWMNGITTLDLVFIRRHVLNLQPLDSPYKMIAADVNKSSSVTTSDIVSLRRMILTLDEVFPNDNTSYRFVDAEYAFPDANNPWSSGFPEVYNINNLEADMLSTDFMAIKVGDVNGSAIYNFNQDSGEERSSGTQLIELQDQEMKAGELYSIPFNAVNFERVLGYQFALEFDTDRLEFVEITTNEESDLSLANFGLTQTSEGIILVSRDKAENTLYNTNTLFNITFKAKSNTTISQSLYISSRGLKAEAYVNNETIDIHNIKLNFSDATTDFALFQNAPNPFTELTTISFNLPTASHATLTVFDIDGKVLTTVEGDYAQGMNTVEMRKSDLRASGVAFYQLETATQTATRKMIILE